MKKSLVVLLAITLAAAMLLPLAGCQASPTPAATVAPTTAASAAPASAAPAAKGVKVGVAMPTQSLQRWNQDGANIVQQLKSAGYDSILQYANNDVNTQVGQIENMVTQGCKILVIAAIDGSSLTDVLATAAKNGVKVIAYDRLIMQTANVDYYVTFDNEKVGQLQGTYVEEALKLKTEKGPFNVEWFGGDPGDNNALLFNKGEHDVLDTYLTSGVLKVPSGQTEFAKIAIPSWTTATAQTRMDNLITTYYASGTKLDAVISPNDSLALGASQSLVNAGYGAAGKAFPIITGQDCDVANVKAMIAGKQAMSIFKDTRDLAKKAVEMISAIETNATVPVNDTTNYNNKVKVVPSFLLTPYVVTKDNYQKILVDSGYYTADQLK